MSTKKQHKHAELMLQYAQDAMETNEPWARWEYKAPYSEWMPLYSGVSFIEPYEYRRKQKTININGFEVPEPMREKPEIGEKYFAVCEGLNAVEQEWDEFECEFEWLENGLFHKTKEAAELHAKALLSFTKKQ